MLLGLHTNILEKNNHLALPASFREIMAAEVYITSGFDRNIMVLTLQAFQEIYDKITSLNLANPVARLLLRMILGSAHKVMVAPDGKIVIPDVLKTFAGLEHEVTLVGQGDFIEIWSSENWYRQAEQLLHIEANQFSTLTITTR